MINQANVEAEKVLSEANLNDNEESLLSQSTLLCRMKKKHGENSTTSVR